jgi:t-SNARE complex subunit (syntaxin)
MFKMDDPFFTVPQFIKQRDFIQLLTRESENLTRNHRRLLASYSEDTVDVRSVRRLEIKWSDSDGN